jgi:hypothetical protein
VIAQLVEQTAVNRQVAGSSPAHAAFTTGNFIMNPRKRKARVLAALEEAAKSAAKTETLIDDVLLKRTAEMAVETGMITEQEATAALKPLEKTTPPPLPPLKKPLTKEVTDGEKKQTTTTRTKKAKPKRSTKSTKSKRTTKSTKPKRTTKTKE